MKFLIFSLLTILGSYLYSFAGWQIETVDTGVIGSSLALDSDNYPHIAYSKNFSLEYAFFDGLNWQISVVDSSGAITNHFSVALDNAGNPHISYSLLTTPPNQAWLKHAYYNGTNWQITTVCTLTGDYDNSIAIDNNGNPHIAFFSDFQFKYARFDGENWQISVLDLDGLYGSCSIAVESNGNPDIAYERGAAPSFLKYAHYTGSVWQISGIDSAASLTDRSLSLDSNDQPHISYPKLSNLGMRYASSIGSSWAFIDFDTSAGCGESSIDIDTLDNPHISYIATDQPPLQYNHLKYAFYDGVDWEISVVDPSEFGGHYNSLSLDSSDHPHISYTTSSSAGILKYASYIDDTGVNLLSFSAQPQSNSSIKLLWQVSASDSSEIVGFNLYRAPEGKTHKKDFFKLNHSPITGKNPYQFVDSSVTAGQSYLYRLSALTADGKEQMLGSTQGTAGSTPARFALTAVFPNPAKSLLTCRVTMPQTGSITLGLYDITGRLVLSKQVELASGEQDMAVDVGNLARGIYTVKVSTGGESAVKRIVIMR